MSINFSFIGTWLLRLTAAVIMLQTLYFKFSGAAESVYIFSQLGLEPYGRIGIAIMELIASLLILWPKTTVYGAVLAMGLMAGALFSHLTKLGFEVQGDGGLLFIYALLVLISAAILVFIYRHQLYQSLRIHPKYRL
jgi:uncharacterized membrane protein YphA (DoxX/SURF4 family)